MKGPIWKEPQTFRLDVLELPGGFEALLTDPDTAAIAASLPLIGMLAIPIVRDMGPDRKVLLAGCKRTAAVMVADPKARTITARVVVCTDMEAELITLTENVCRRHRPTEQAESRRQLIDTVQRMQAAEEINIAEATSRGRGRPPTARSKARRLAAQIAGVAEAALRDADAQPKRKLTAFDARGQDLGEEYLEHVRGLQELFRSVTKEVQRAQLHLVKLRSLVPVAGLNNAIHTLDTAVDQIHGARPTALCSQCLGTAEAQPMCSACNGEGWE